MIENTLFDALFAPWAGRSKPLIVLPDGRKIRGAAFMDTVERSAAALVASGLRPGDRLAMQVEKSVQALAVYGAALAAGVVLLPLNPAYTPQEVDYFIDNAGAGLLLADPARAGALDAVASRRGTRLETLDAAGAGSFADLAAAQPAGFAPVARGPDDLAALLYTSGTTGRSKGAMLSHDNLLSNARVLADLWRFGASDVLLHALPIFHTHGLFVATNISLLTGGSMIFLPRPDTAEMIRLMPQATAMMGVPTFYTRLLDAPDFTRDVAAHMRLFVSGSAPLLAETHAMFQARSGHCILERYGMTETSMNTSNPYDGPRRAGTVGLPLPGVEVIVTDPGTGRPLPAGDVGMVELRGPNVFQGYWGMPEQTARDLRDTGFFITGDLGRFDDAGYLSIVGRQKDLIITGGMNVYPKEVELMLDDQPGVLESAVVGLPHPDLGEAVLAVLVPEPGGRPDVAAIAAALAAGLARFKQPRGYELLPELPRNTMGKVQKNALRDRFAARFRG